MSLLVNSHIRRKKFASIPLLKIFQGSFLVLNNLKKLFFSFHLKHLENLGKYILKKLTSFFMVSDDYTGDNVLRDQKSRKEMRVREVTSA